MLKNREFKVNDTLYTLSDNSAYKNFENEKRYTLHRFNTEQNALNRMFNVNSKAEAIAIIENML